MTNASSSFPAGSLGAQRSRSGSGSGLSPFQASVKGARGLLGTTQRVAAAQATGSASGGGRGGAAAGRSCGAGGSAGPLRWSPVVCMQGAAPEEDSFFATGMHSSASCGGGGGGGGGAASVDERGSCACQQAASAISYSRTASGREVGAGGHGAANPDAGMLGGGVTAVCHAAGHQEVGKHHGLHSGSGGSTSGGSERPAGSADCDNACGAEQGVAAPEVASVAASKVQDQLRDQRLLVQSRLSGSKNGCLQGVTSSPWRGADSAGDSIGPASQYDAVEFGGVLSGGEEEEGERDRQNDGNL